MPNSVKTQTKRDTIDDLPFPDMGTVVVHTLKNPTVLDGVTFPAGLPCKLVRGAAHRMVIFKSPQLDIYNTLIPKIVFYS